jgi:phosphogluconate dehydratase
MKTHDTIQRVTERVIKRSETTRHAYLHAMIEAGKHFPLRGVLSCGNLAHGFAACDSHDKNALKKDTPNIAIISAYNDMLSAHEPYKDYPALIKKTARELGAVAQFAGGVPAMCDGVTQGQIGMELSLFSRDVVAQAAAIALSHHMFDAAMYLGICDKIVPGLLMAAIQFGYLPSIFVPAGPMPSGLPNKEKIRIREQYAKGEIGEEALLEAESASYHSAGTCTFYGTANSNQMLVEMMGVQLPGSSFVNPYTPLRDALTQQAVKHVLAQTKLLGEYQPIYKIIDEKAIINGIIGLLATGGSTNHTIHIIAIARAAGIIVNWDDFDDLSDIIPLLCKIYPNGDADVNHFHAAGGMPVLIKHLLDAGLMHEDVNTVAGKGMQSYLRLPELKGETFGWRKAEASADVAVLSTVAEPFRKDGGTKLLKGNLGRCVTKISAVKPQHYVVEAPARVFYSQEQLTSAFKNGELGGDMVAVVIGQGPKAKGMPELHKLTPPLGVLQNMGFKVALVTDGRMSGASGKVPAAIHVSPEVLAGGSLGKIRDGDIIRLDAEKGTLNALVDEKEWAGRELLTIPQEPEPYVMGRYLFSTARATVSTAETGASFILPAPNEEK